MEETEVVLTCSEMDAMAVMQQTHMPALALPAGLSSLPQEVESCFCRTVYSECHYITCFLEVNKIQKLVLLMQNSYCSTVKLAQYV